MTAQMLFIVYDALDDAHPGMIVCTPPDGFAAPYYVRWVMESSKAKDEKELDLDASRLCARRVPPGTYTVIVVDAKGAEARGRVTLQQMDLPSIVGYSGIPATSASARNGTVRVDVRNAPLGCRYFWSTGVTTDKPELPHVPPGDYAVTLVGAAGASISHLCSAPPYRLSCDPGRQLQSPKT